MSLLSRPSSLNACSSEMPDLDVVGARHVGRREPLGAPARAGNRRRQRRGRPVAVAGGQFEDRPVVTRDARLREVHPVRRLPREAGLEEQPVRHRHRPRALHHARRIPVPPRDRFDGRGPGVRRCAAARLLDVRVEVNPLLAGRLPRQAPRVVPIPVEARRRLARGVERRLVRERRARLPRIEQRRRVRVARFFLQRIVIGARLVRALAPARDRREVPQPVVHDRPARLPAEAEDLLHLAGRVDPERPQRVVDVRALHRAVREVAVHAAVERVAAALGNRVERRAARAGLGAHARRLELQLLNVAAVGDVPHARRRADEILVPEAVERGARPRLAVIEGVGALRRPGVARAADIGLRRGEARRHVRQRLQPDVAARQVFELRRAERGLLANRLRVHDRRRTRDRDGLRDGAHRHGDVDRSREPRPEHNALAPDRREPGEREGDRVVARPQVDDVVAALRIRDRGPHLLNQGRTGRFDRDAWHGQVVVVADDAGDAGRLLGRNRPRPQ